MIGKSVFLYLVVAIAAVSPAYADNSIPHDVTLGDVLRLTERTSPDLKAAMDRERTEGENITIQKSAYYPSVTAEAVESWGFPASNGALGLTGLIGSPFRSGPAAGLTSSLDLVDIGRRSKVRSARASLLAVQQQTKVLRFQVDQMALQLFLDASRFRGQEDAARAIFEDVIHVQNEVNRFVKTGQRSVVERLLVQDQTTEAKMTAATFHERYRVARERLALLMNVSPESVTCPSPELLSERSLGISSSTASSPLLARAAAEAAMAHENVSVSSAENYPKVTATGSVGDMDQSRLVDKKEYAGGFGVTLPLFEGHRISAEIRRASALASEKDEDVLAARMTLDDTNARYDELIDSSRVKLQYLVEEQAVARKAFQLAKDRYVSFQGTLVDVREALRNLERVESELIDVKADLLLAVGAKALLNGGVPT